jgi:hypothetical protein
MVIKGESGPDLLLTYDAERRPVVQFTMNQTVLRSADCSKLVSEENRNQIKINQQSSQIVDDLEVMLGYRYYSDAIMSEDSSDSSCS